MPENPPLSFTVRYEGKTDVLETEVLISAAFDPSASEESLNPHQFTSIWDTGATNSAISRKVVEECGLKPISMAQVRHAEGIMTSPVYLINMVLPNSVGFSHLRVTESILEENDVLIGMDVIGAGDFALTHKDGKSTLSFRAPSLEEIDFLGQEKQKQPKIAPYRKPTPKVGRNEPCPCGSGKKYKKCCGRPI